MASTAAKKAEFKSVPTVEMVETKAKAGGGAAGTSPASAADTDKSKTAANAELKDAHAMTFFELMVVLKPFFWPAEGTDGALVNRIRAVSTWGAVMISKACSLWAPLFLLDATNELVLGDWESAKNNTIAFVGLKLASSFFKEIQGVSTNTCVCARTPVLCVCVCLCVCDRKGMM